MISREQLGGIDVVLLTHSSTLLCILRVSSLAKIIRSIIRLISKARWR